MKFTKILILSLLLALFAGCGAPVARGNRLIEDATPIQTVTVQVFPGDLEQFGKLSAWEIATYRDDYVPAFATRFPEIFKTNGIEVQSTQIFRGSTPRMPLPLTNASHALIIRLSGVSYTTRNGSKFSLPETFFEVQLIELATKKVVWSASQSMTIFSKQPNRGMEYLAGSIINSLDNAKFFNLKGRSAVDLQGEPIQKVLMPQKDK